MFSLVLSQLISTDTNTTTTTTDDDDGGDDNDDDDNTTTTTTTTTTKKCIIFNQRPYEYGCGIPSLLVNRLVISSGGVSSNHFCNNFFYLTHIWNRFLCWILTRNSNLPPICLTKIFNLSPPPIYLSIPNYPAFPSLCYLLFHETLHLLGAISNFDLRDLRPPLALHSSPPPTSIPETFHYRSQRPSTSAPFVTISGFPSSTIAHRGHPLTSHLRRARSSPSSAIVGDG
ncbi:unnamed protein product [Lactuca saligna]|uniref:Uncharacterized protein n=1 Tax=Lactuca saligna TaxID=75948 RepID=A0AA35VQU0_LACSI|nr:unnamed protein product [Lactuca saligna]